MKRVLFLLILSIALVGCSNGSQAEKTESEEVEGITAELAVKSNSKASDEGFFEANIENETDKTFIGNITFHHSSFKIWTEEVNIPPNSEVKKELKTSYIEHPEDGYTYKVKGEFSDESFESDVSYKLYKTDVDTSVSVQIDEVTKENVIAITKELLSTHGDTLKNIKFFDSTASIVDGATPEVFPEAEFHGNNVSKTISIYGENEDETFDFEAE